MNEEPTILSELLNVLHEEELIRLAYRLRRAGKLLSSFALDHQLAERLAQRSHFSGTTPPPVTPQNAPGPS
jgi:hypothetical protein